MNNINVTSELAPRLPLRGALLDLDGVLVDTARLHFEGWQQVAAKLGFTLDTATGDLLKGVSRDEALQIVVRTGGMELATDQRMEMSDWKNAWYQEQVDLLDATALLAGAADMLKWLRAKGIPLALASSSRNAARILQSVGIAGYFDAIVDAAALRHTKPDPEIFLRAAQAIGVPARACVVIEDSLAGIDGAHRAGCVAIGVGDRDVLAHADLVVASLTDIPLDVVFGPYPPDVRRD
ncbi:beta-phosphoglucomutase [Marmoricola sp. URHA0025 HA25]